MAGLEDRGAQVIHILPKNNETWEFGPFNYTTYLGIGTLGWCSSWRPQQHYMFHLSNACFFISYAIPSTKFGIIFMHALLVLGFLIFCTWSWVIVCVPDVFVWNLAYMFINFIQLVIVLYKLRPVKFDPELEEVYQTLFWPFKVTRSQFKKLIGINMAQIVSLHAGEAYAMQNLTRCDRLSILVSGKLNVICDDHFLHPILPCEFLDSPEFESRANIEDKFKVSIVAATSCRYLYWQRTTLEYLFAKDTYIGTVISTLIARDIATKLYAMNNKIVTEKGFHLDIRLPCITATLGAAENKSPTVKALRKHAALYSEERSPSSDHVSQSNSRERLVKPNSPLPNGKLFEILPFTESRSQDELGSSCEVESWLETSSKYHSCEVVDD